MRIRGLETLFHEKPGRQGELVQSLYDQLTSSGSSLLKRKAGRAISGKYIPVYELCNGGVIQRDLDVLKANIIRWNADTTCAMVLGKPLGSNDLVVVGGAHSNWDLGARGIDFSNPLSIPSMVGDYPGQFFMPGGFPDYVAIRGLLNANGTALEAHVGDFDSGNTSFFSVPTGMPLELLTSGQRVDLAHQVAVQVGEKINTLLHVSSSPITSP